MPTDANTSDNPKTIITPQIVRKFFGYKIPGHLYVRFGTHETGLRCSAYPYLT